MIEEGALDGVKAIFGMHVCPFMPTGIIDSRPGPIMAGSGRFTAIMQGKGGHAAAPHKTKDPILAVSMAVLALQQLISRETDPLESRVWFALIPNSQNNDFTSLFRKGALEQR